MQPCPLTREGGEQRGTCSALSGTDSKVLSEVSEGADTVSVQAPGPSPPQAWTTQILPRVGYPCYHHLLPGSGQLQSTGRRIVAMMVGIRPCTSVRLFIYINTGDDLGR